ncbi:MAG: polysaccharide biosynthesis tyrosine autokinase [Planctomycetales bacterium]|nr:polysaccharide biosynthesis tyrosine autokinase [Planctomycetales bacterium]
MNSPEQRGNELAIPTQAPGYYRQQPPASESAVTPQFVLTVFRLWWLYALPAGLLLAAAAAAGVWLLWTPTYEAQATVWIFQKYNPLGTRAEPHREFVQSQKALIRSSSILNVVSSRPEVSYLPELKSGRRTPAESLRSMISIRDEGADLYAIVCQAKDPNSAKIIADEVLASYLTMVQEFSDQRSGERQASLATEIRKQESDLAELEAQLRGMLAEDVEFDTDMVDSKLAAIPVHPLSELDREIVNLDLQLVMIKREIELIESGKLPTLAAEDLQKALELHPELQLRRQDLDAMAAEIEQRKQLFQPGHRDERTEELQAERKRLIPELAKREKEIEAELTKKHQEVHQGQQDKRLEEQRKELGDLEHRRQLLVKRREEKLQKMVVSSGNKVKIELKRQELACSQELVLLLKKRLLDLEVGSRQVAHVRADQTAKIPTFPVEAAPLKKMVMAGGAMMLVPFGIAVFWEVRHKRISDAEDLKNRQLLPLIGEVASFPRLLGRRKVSERVIRHFEDTIDNLRTYIDLSSGSGQQVIAVCSSASGEGKTTISSQLASSIARTTNKRILLIDGDMRLPDVHATFQIEQGPGLVEVLTGEFHPSKVVVEEWSEGLHLLPAGQLGSQSPHRLLNGDHFEELMTWARENYDFVVIDTPPVLTAMESLKLAAASDATLLCVMRDVSRLEQVEATCDRLRQAGAPLAGCVLSGVSRKRFSYRYGGYSYY